MSGKSGEAHDAGTKEEKAILKSGAEVKADVLKVGHQGSLSSTSEAMVKAVKPRWAVVSCSGQYGLPKEAIIERLERYRAEVHRTDIEGTIVTESDGEEMTVATGF